MKKILVATIIGVSAVVSSFGQGSILFNNYVTGTYNQVVWGPGTPNPNSAVLDGTIQLQLLFGAGVVTDINALTAGVTVNINPALTFDADAGHGGGGYFTGPTQLLPAWTAGSTYTFAIRVLNPGYSILDPVLWQETANIHASNVPQAGFANFPGAIVVVPEPTTFALAGLGSAALLIFRRRN